MKLLDIHIHIGQLAWNEPQLSADALLEWMDEQGIERCVLLALESPEVGTYPFLSREAIAAAKQHPDRLIPFACVDPRVYAPAGVEGWLKVLQMYVDGGAQGFGEFKCGLPIDHPRSVELYAAAGELGWPVLIHMDARLNYDDPGLPNLEKVVSSLPNVDFIMHNGHWWAEISAGLTADQRSTYPPGAVKPIGAADRLLCEYPNVYGDISAGSGYNALTRDPEFGREFMIRHQDKLLFGTDYLYPGQPTPVIKLLEEIDIPEEAREKIASGNAELLLARGE